MTNRDFVVLVDEHGLDLMNPIGGLLTIQKMKAHRDGLKHKAVSVFVFNDHGEVLLQKRSANKDHSANKWSNTCCTHPSPGEMSVVAAKRRLGEEMGLVVKLTEVFTFSYYSDTGNGYIENEFDHVCFGFCSQSPKPDPDEVSDWKWITTVELEKGLATSPDKYSPWLRQCFDQVIKQQANILQNSCRAASISTGFVKNSVH